MIDFNSSAFLNSGQVFSHLLLNKTPITIYFEDNSKISGIMLGWDANFLLIHDGKTLQIVQLTKFIRLQADLGAISLTPETTPLPESPSIPKPPRIKLAEAINESVVTEKVTKTDQPSPERLDHLVRNL